MILIGAAAGHATGAKLTPLSHVPRPRVVITQDEKLTAISEGVGLAVGVAFEMSGRKREYQFARKVVDLAVDGSIASVDSRNALAESDLRVIDLETAKLAEIIDAHGDLSDPNAQALVAHLKTRSRMNESGWSFYRRAVFSKTGLYAFAITAGLSKLDLKEGWAEGSAKPIRKAWLDAQRARQGTIHRAAWKRMKERSKFVRLLSEKLLEQTFALVLDKQFKGPLGMAVNQKIATCYEGRLHGAAASGEWYDIAEIRELTERCSYVVETEPIPPALALETFTPEFPVPEFPALPQPAVAVRVEPVVRAVRAEPIVQAVRAKPIVPPVRAVPVRVVREPAQQQDPPAVAEYAPTQSAAPSEETQSRSAPRMPDICRQSFDGNSSVCPP